MTTSTTSTENTPPRPDWERLGPVLLVGHRGSGKSTLGRICAERLARPFVDLDDHLVRELGEAFDEVLTDDPQRFRRLEAELLTRLSTEHPAPIISCGAGVHPLPTNAFVVWIEREDWQEEVARSNRPRVRPDLSEREEWAWMEKTRPPRWLERAHLRLHISRGRTVRQSADELATLLCWAASVAESELARKTFLVPSSPKDLARAVADVERFGFGGIEIRSDVFSLFPRDLPVPAIASLRHADPRWLSTSEAPIWDIDSAYFDAAFQIPLPRQPEKIIVSAHPDRVFETDINELVRRGADLTELGLSPSQIELKWAPETDVLSLSTLFALSTCLRSQPYLSTVIPQGARFAWARPLLADANHTTYLPVGLRQRNPAHPSAMDFQAFLPHLAGPTPLLFDVLLGDPVEQSRGDYWHRKAALASSEERTGYLKIPTAPAEFEPTLELLSRLPVRGVSITAPLKKIAAKSAQVSTPDALPAINTLRRSDQERPWLATDTDELGMLASLEHLEQAGIDPGAVIIFGRGGASHALCRAIENSAWTLLANISARRGWSPDHGDLGPVQLIINAAGPGRSRSAFAPQAAAWLDLHYNDVEPAPAGSYHLQGDLFFEAQARAQRVFWHGEEKQE